MRWKPSGTIKRLYAYIKNRGSPGKRDRLGFLSPFPHRRAVGGGHSLMGRSVGRGLDPSVGVCERQGACPPPRGRGRAYPARGFSRGWEISGASGTPPPTRVAARWRAAARTCGGVRAPRPTDVIHVSAVGAAYMPPASLCGMPFAGCCFSFNIGLAIRLKMYPRCRAWTFDNRLHPTLFSVRLHLCF